MSRNTIQAILMLLTVASILVGVVSTSQACLMAIASQTVLPGMSGVQGMLVFSSSMPIWCGLALYWLSPKIGGWIHQRQDVEWKGTVPPS